NYLIIDSDATSNLQLQHMLEEYGEFYCSDVAKNATAGVNSILKFSPDLVFINLNDNAHQYFQMVAELYRYIQDIPVMIGIYNSKEYDYESIKNNVMDYWLLTFDEVDIPKTIKKIQKGMAADSSTSQTICFKSYKAFQYLETDNMLNLRADNN